MREKESLHEGTSQPCRWEVGPALPPACGLPCVCGQLQVLQHQGTRLHQHRAGGEAGCGEFLQGNDAHAVLPANAANSDNPKD